jgi:hypothetical protein
MLDSLLNNLVNSHSYGKCPSYRDLPMKIVILHSKLLVDQRFFS